MLISGNGNIGEVRNSIQDTIITKEIDSQMQKRALSYYSNAINGLEEFDTLFSANATDTLIYLTWCSQMPNRSVYANDTEYAVAVAAWQNAIPNVTTEIGTEYAASITNWQNEMPVQNNFFSEEEYLTALTNWNKQSPATQENAITIAYAGACQQLQSNIEQKAVDTGYQKDSTEAQEMLGSVMYTLNPNGIFNDFYTENHEDIPSEYDIFSIVTHIAANDLSDYLSSEYRTDYRLQRAKDCVSIFLAGNMTKADSVE